MKQGFTLVELTIVVGILSIILLAISAPFVNILQYQRNSQQNDNVRDNMQFILNVLDKELRTSSNPSSTGPGQLQVTNQDGVLVTYTLSGGVLQKNGVAITDPTIFTLTNVQFSINTNGSPTVPVITVILTAIPVSGGESITMQGTTMPRN